MIALIYMNYYRTSTFVPKSTHIDIRIFLQFSNLRSPDSKIESVTHIDNVKVPTGLEQQQNIDPI